MNGALQSLLCLNEAIGNEVYSDISNLKQCRPGKTSEKWSNWAFYFCCVFYWYRKLKSLRVTMSTVLAVRQRYICVVSSLGFRENSTWPIFVWPWIIAPMKTLILAHLGALPWYHSFEHQIEFFFDKEAVYTMHTACDFSWAVWESSIFFCVLCKMFGEFGILLTKCKLFPR